MATRELVDYEAMSEAEIVDAYYTRKARRVERRLGRPLTPHELDRLKVQHAAYEHSLLPPCVGYWAMIQYFKRKYNIASYRDIP